MNFPVGRVVMKGELPSNIYLTIQELVNSGFNGYIIQSIKSWCVQEGVIFFRDGKVIASIVECSFVKKNLKGDEAFLEFLNQTLVKGYYQIVELSRSQIDLIIAFDQKLLFSKEIVLKDVTKLIPNKFIERFSFDDTKKDVFGAYGLGALR
jgi:hypothetical protein